MNVFAEIEQAVVKEFDKLKVKLETFDAIAKLEAEIEKLKAKLEGSATPTEAIATAQSNAAAIVKAAQPTMLRR